MVFKVQNKVVESKTCAGVTLCIRRITKGRRSRIGDEMAPHLVELNKIQAALEQVNKAPDTDDVDKETDKAAMLTELLHRLTRVRAAQDQLFVKAGLVWLTGLDVEDDPITSDVDLHEWFRENAPEELYEEVVELVRANLALDGAREQNLGSLTTSVEQEGGTASDSTAQPV